MDLNNLIVHCPDREDYIKLVELVRWRSGFKRENNWYFFKSQTAINIENNKINGFATIEWYKGLYQTCTFTTAKELINKLTPMFKIGDKVKIKSRSVPNWNDWETVIIVFPQEKGYYYGYVNEMRGDRSGKDSDNCIFCHTSKDKIGGYFFASQDLELIPETLTMCKKLKPWNKPIIKTDINNLLTKKTLMENIVEFAKNLKLSKEEKLLRKYGLKNSDGEYTEEYNELRRQKANEEFETQAIEIAKAMDKENK